VAGPSAAAILAGEDVALSLVRDAGGVLAAEHRV
jgi:hypothetical protein